MCGRFTQRHSGREVARHFGLADAPPLEARYNAAPGQALWVVRAGPEGQRCAEPRVWGLVPPWADDPRLGSRLVNARAESAARRRAFGPALRARRCLVPADGFFEWGRHGGRRVPFHVRRPDQGLFGMAGLYETWTGPGDRPLETFTILTTAAVPPLAALHERMPVLLPEEAYAAWLDPGRNDAAEALALLRETPPPELVFSPVGLRVNRVEHDDPACLDPLPEPAQRPLF